MEWKLKFLFEWMGMNEKEIKFEWKLSMAEGG